MSIYYLIFSILCKINISENTKQQQAQVLIVVNVCMKFHEPSLHSFGDMVRTKASSIIIYNNNISAIVFKILNFRNKVAKGTHLTQFIVNVCTEFLKLTCTVLKTQSGQNYRIKKINISGNQHLPMVVNVCIPFHEASLYGNGERLWTKKSQLQSISILYQPICKNKNFQNVKIPKGTSTVYTRV